MSVIFQTVVGGTGRVTLAYCPEFIIVGNPFDNTANLLPSSLQVTVGGKQTIALITTALIQAFSAKMGNLTESNTGTATGAVRLGKVYRLAYGRIEQTTDIAIVQPVGGAIQDVCGFSTQRGEGSVVVATQAQINANTPQLFRDFDFLAIDGAVTDYDVKYKNSKWFERMTAVEQQAFNTMRRSLDPAGTIGGLVNVFLNDDKMYETINIYNGAAARNAMTITSARV